MSCSVCVASPFILLYSIKESLSIFSLPVSRKGVLNKVLHGESPSRGPTLYLLHTIFYRKASPVTDLRLQYYYNRKTNTTTTTATTIIITIIKEKINAQTEKVGAGHLDQ